MSGRWCWGVFSHRTPHSNCFTRFDSDLDEMEVCSDEVWIGNTRVNALCQYLPVQVVSGVHCYPSL